jgi:hypothetical protein
MQFSAADIYKLAWRLWPKLIRLAEAQAHG